MVFVSLGLVDQSQIAKMNGHARDAALGFGVMTVVAATALFVGFGNGVGVSVSANLIKVSASVAAVSASGVVLSGGLALLSRGAAERSRGTAERRKEFVKYLDEWSENPGVTGEQKKLRKDVANRMITAFDDDASWLILKDLQQTSLPGAIRYLKNLEVLDLSGNRLARLPSEVLELKNLQVLDVSNNVLDVFPQKVNQLQNLKELDLSKNQLGELPEDIELPNLNVLDLSRNELAFPLPQSLVLLQKSRKLVTTGNW